MRNLAAALVLLISCAARAQFGAGPAPEEAPPPPPPTESERNSQLQRELEAERSINAALRARLRELESGTQISTAPQALPTPILESDAGAISAIAEALLRRNLAVLPSGMVRAAARFDWIHNGSGDTRSDAYVATFAPSVGLPADAMLSAEIPFVRAETSSASNSSLGDVGFAVTKQLVEETAGHPSFLASVGYVHDSGKAFRDAPTGGGFKVLSASLAAVKSLEPVVLFGNLSYGHPFARRVEADGVLGEPEFRGRIEPGDQFGFRAGASLLAAPTIDFDASVSGLFAGTTKVSSSMLGTYELPSSTVVLAELGASFVLSRNLALLTSVSAGITDDAPDLAIEIALPYRF